VAARLILKKSSGLSNNEVFWEVNGTKITDDSEMYHHGVTLTMKKFISQDAKTIKLFVKTLTG